VAYTFNEREISKPLLPEEALLLTELALLLLAEAESPLELELKHPAKNPRSMSKLFSRVRLVGVISMFPALKAVALKRFVGFRN